MRSKKLLAAFCIFTCFCFADCKKKSLTELDKLPPETQTGANTMGCLINGKAWVPDTRDDVGVPRLPAISVSFWNNKTLLLFDFYVRRGSDKQNLTAFVTNFDGVGNYSMNLTSRVIGVPGSTGDLNSHFYYSDYVSNTSYATNITFNGNLNISYYDSVNRTISGNFSFKAQNQNGTLDSLVVTNGRYDCKMK